MCWPSNGTLAELAGCHPNQLGGHLRYLHATGWIKNLQRNGDKHSARYIAMLRRLDPKLPVAPAGATWETAEAERVTGNQVTPGEGYVISSDPVTGKPITPLTGNQVTGVTGNHVTNNHAGETARILNGHAVELQLSRAPRGWRRAWVTIPPYERPHTPRAGVGVMIV